MWTQHYKWLDFKSHEVAGLLICYYLGDVKHSYHNKVNTEYSSSVSSVLIYVILCWLWSWVCFITPCLVYPQSMPSDQSYPLYHSEYLMEPHGLNLPVAHVTHNLFRRKKIHGLEDGLLDISVVNKYFHSSSQGNHPLAHSFDMTCVLSSGWREIFICPRTFPCIIA